MNKKFRWRFSAISQQLSNDVPKRKKEKGKGKKSEGAKSGE
jgi:hypothetical protein